MTDLPQSNIPNGTDEPLPDFIKDTKEDRATIERLKKCLTDAINAFDRIDKRSLLAPGKREGVIVSKNDPRWGGAGERAIAHRLAVHLENALYDNKILPSVVTVDCEYNRHLDDIKTQRVSEEFAKLVRDAKRKPLLDTDDDNFYVFSIAPDIIVHERGIDTHNLLVIEIKKASNKEDDAYDRLKLEQFTQGIYRYKLGAFVIADDTVDPDLRKLRVEKWF